MNDAGANLSPPGSPPSASAAPVAAADAPRPTLAVNDAIAFSPIARLACWFIAGVALGAFVARPMLWLLVGAVGFVAALVYARLGRARPALCWAAVALLAAAAGWTTLRLHYVPADHISQYLFEDAQLAEATGVIDSQVNITAAQRGAMAAFSYEAPATMFALRLDTLVIGGADRPASGRLFVKIRETDLRLREGMRVRVRGWMAAIDGPNNPGEADYRRIMADRDIDGRITLAVAGNCIIENDSGALPGAYTIHQRVSDAASESLRLGLQRDAQRVAFLDTLLLGRRAGGLGDLSESFRKVGLAHLLSISGAHLGIALLLVWTVVRMILPLPARAAVIVFIVLVFYMIAVPWRVPIVRAGIMAGLFCFGGATGRRVRGIDLVALAAVIVLIWRPGDLFSAGFQLSFGVVAGLLLFTRPVGKRLWPGPPVPAPGHHMRDNTARWCADIIAANLVAFLIAWPVVAYHFQIISPLSIVLTLMALLPVTMVLGLGYLKIIVGLVFPTAGLLLAGPLEWASDVMTGLVEHAATWPGASVELANQPPLAWVFAAMAVTLAWLCGGFIARRAPLLASIAVCLSWLIADANAWAQRFQEQPAAIVNMFAVSDGSCFLIRLYDGRDEPYVIMFDCGSQAYLDTGQRSIVPALRNLRVRHIDTLILSHADIDHFNGVPDLLDDVTVGRALVPPQLLAEARDRPRSTTAFLVEALRAHHVPIETVTRGHGEIWAGAEAAILWPPADFDADRANDTSLVLSLRIAGRRIMLSGDIDRLALPMLLDTEQDLRADIADLPHHGSFHDDSPRWLARVGPEIVLQSSGKARLRNDKWADEIARRNLTRLITAQRGMVELRIQRDGTVGHTSFRQPAPADLSLYPDEH